MHFLYFTADSHIRLTMLLHFYLTSHHAPTLSLAGLVAMYQITHNMTYTIYTVLCFSVLIFRQLTQANVHKTFVCALSILAVTAKSHPPSTSNMFGELIYPLPTSSAT